LKLVVGLGNPGPQYAFTRHNVGFRVVERFAARHGLQFQLEAALAARAARGSIRLPAGQREVVLLEPLTFMNRAGQSVGAAVQALGIEDLSEQLVLIYDDLDLPFGRLRLRSRGGAGGHRGVADVQERLGSDAFARLRIGIGRPHPGGDPVAYVLEPFTPAEERELGVRLDGAGDALEVLIEAGVTAAMNRFNAPPPEALGG